LPERVAERLIALGVATLHEAEGRRPVMRDVRLLVGEPFAGPAVTVGLPAGDNLGIHLALEAAGPGSVVCVASAGRGVYGVFGDLLHLCAAGQGVVALVIDDGIRDVAHLPPSPAVAARGISAHGTIKRRLRQPVGASVAMGGVLVAPGDWIVGDGDGIYAIPAAEVEAVIAKAEGRERKEDGLRPLLAAGQTTRAVLGLPTDRPASLV
jgi:4-hydroxy-4-methyl-2-oxoglutarate aldolase